MWAFVLSVYLCVFVIIYYYASSGATTTSILQQDIHWFCQPRTSDDESHPSHNMSHCLLLQFADPEYIPATPDRGPITVDNAAERLFLRCERQVSLFPLPLLVIHLLLFSTSFIFLCACFFYLRFSAPPFFPFPLPSCSFCNPFHPACSQGYQQELPVFYLVSSASNQFPVLLALPVLKCCGQGFSTCISSVTLGDCCLLYSFLTYLTTTFIRLYCILSAFVFRNSKKKQCDYSCQENKG